MTTSTLIKFLILIFIISSSCSKNETLEITEPEIENITIPVNIYKYNFNNATALSSSLSLNEMEIYFERINEIWEQANIKFIINSFETIEVDDEIFLTNDYLDFSNRDFRIELENLSETHININSMTNQGIWTLVLIKKFPHPAGGVWSKNTEIVFFAETKNNERVVENILAHEFGHSLSLTHLNPNQYPTNLMKAGDGNPLTAELLLDYQINSARQRALLFLN